MQYGVHSKGPGEQDDIRQAMNSLEKYRIIFDRMTDGIVVIQNGYVVFLNPVIMEITGFTWNELIQRPIIRLVHHDDAASIKCFCEKISGANSDHQHAQIKIVTRDASIKTVAIKGNEIEWDDSTATLIFVSDPENES